MPFDHERLDVYRVALDSIVLADETIAQLPRGRSHLADQLHRAATSIVLNIAEGAGKLSKPDKRRYDLSASGSATERAAIFVSPPGSVGPMITGITGNQGPTRWSGDGSSRSLPRRKSARGRGARHTRRSGVPGPLR